jgi:hypothetical protein
MCCCNATSAVPVMLPTCSLHGCSRLQQLCTCCVLSQLGSCYAGPANNHYATQAVLQALTCRVRQPRSCSSCISAPVAVGRPPTSCAASDTFSVAPSMSTKCSHRSRSVRDGLSLPLNSSLFQQRIDGSSSRRVMVCA